MNSSVKLKLATLAAVVSGTLLSSARGHADVLATRCAADTQNPARARLRLEWARACGTTVNLVSPTAPQAPAFAYQNGLFSANDGSPLWEYIETDDFWGKNSYSGVDAAVNQIFTENQWRTGPYTATTDAAGFQKWTESDTLALARPTYPTFGDNLDINAATPLYPNPNYALHDCKLYTDRAATQIADTSATGFYVNGFCTSNDVPCGNGVCDSTENASTCPEDCPPCGDGICSFNEDAWSCPTDCGFCGDGICSFNEDAWSCPTDCGDGSSCSCSGGWTYWQTTIPASDTSCGFQVCGGDNQLYVCQSYGWQAVGGSPCDCRCTDGVNSQGYSINPDYTYCGYTVCGTDFQNYTCTASGWSAQHDTCQ